MTDKIFFFAYYGGKSKEYKYIAHLLHDYDFDTFIEPFAGSYATIRKINTDDKFKDKKIKFLINDTDEELIQFYNYVKRYGTKGIVKNGLEILKDINKEKYDAYIRSQPSKLKEKANVYWFKHAISSFRIGLFPTKDIEKFKKYEIDRYKHQDAFIKKLTISNVDYKEIVNKHKDDPKCVIYLDPPYFLAYNEGYKNKGKGFGDNWQDDEGEDPTREYIYLKNLLETAKALIIFIINKTELIKYFFGTDLVLGEYAVTYQSTKKKNKHLIISNYNKKKTNNQPCPNENGNNQL